MLVGRVAEPTKEERGYSLRDGLFNDGFPSIVWDEGRLVCFRRGIRQNRHQKRMYGRQGQHDFLRSWRMPARTWGRVSNESGMIKRRTGTRATRR